MDKITFTVQPGNFGKHENNLEVVLRLKLTYLDMTWLSHGY